MPKLLDLFCGAGGASAGYYRAGYEVTGVDILPHKDYPFDFIQADALAVVRDIKYLDQFEVVHASPPCPHYSTITFDKLKHPDLIPEVRAFLVDWGGDYVIENVENSPLNSPLLLCGSMFGLRTRRHRLFESSAWLPSLDCKHREQVSPTVGVYGSHPDRKAHQRTNGKSRGVKACSTEEAQSVLGIDWMNNWDDLADAIPPAYTRWIGKNLLKSRVVKKQNPWGMTPKRA